MGSNSLTGIIQDRILPAFLSLPIPYPGTPHFYRALDAGTLLPGTRIRDLVSTTITSSLDVVRRIRAVRDQGIPGLDSVQVLLDGFQAAHVDMQDEMLRRFPMMIAVVLLITAIAMFLAFQSLLVPLKAVVMNSLSVAGPFGLIVLVFQKGVGGALLGLNGPTDAIYVLVPVLVFAMVFGLSMDYEVFLLARIKEAFDRSGRNSQATMEELRRHGLSDHERRGDHDHRVEATQAPATQAPAAAPADTGSDLITVDNTLGAGWFVDMTRTNSQLSLRCKLFETITFKVKPTDATITEVQFYYRIQDRATGAIFDWQNAGRMISEADGTFTLAFKGEQVNADSRRPNAWLDYQFVGLSRTGGVVGRSEKIEQQITYTFECP